MATFAKRTFDSARYALFRPTYPRQLFELVFTYHEQTRGARWNLAVDLGCGTGSSRVTHRPVFGERADNHQVKRPLS